MMLLPPFARSIPIGVRRHRCFAEPLFMRSRESTPAARPLARIARALLDGEHFPSRARTSSPPKLCAASYPSTSSGETEMGAMVAISISCASLLSLT